MFHYAATTAECMFLFYILDMQNIAYQQNKSYFRIAKIKVFRRITRIIEVVLNERAVGGELLFSPPDFLFVQKQGIFVQTDTDGGMRVCCWLIWTPDAVVLYWEKTRRLPYVWRQKEISEDSTVS